MCHVNHIFGLNRQEFHSPASQCNINMFTRLIHDIHIIVIFNANFYSGQISQGIFGCIAGGIAWIFCTAAGSLLASCCGNDKPSTVPPGVNSGRKRSILLLLISIGLSLFYQYYVGPALKPESIDSYNPVLAYVGKLLHVMHT
jgi:hypothetical protein